MVFPWKRKPYVVRLASVSLGGSPVSGATIKLQNLTKGTETSVVSSESDSNAAIPLAKAGEFDIGDQIRVTATKDGKYGTSDHTTNASDNGRWSFVDIPIGCGGAKTYYVKIGGNNALDGMSYANAWATLRHASENTRDDCDDVVRIGEGAYTIDGYFDPKTNTSWMGGYYDGGWADWTEGCGHDRPVVTNYGATIYNIGVTFDNITFDTTNAPIVGGGVALQFTNCAYTGMYYVDPLNGTFTNTDSILHVTASVNPTITTVHHILTITQFHNVVAYPAKITTDADIVVGITTWGLSGDQNKEWTVEATGSRTVTFQLGDMLTGTKYDLKVGGAKVSDATSDASGVVTFPAYTGSFSEKTFTTEVSADTFVPRVMFF